MLDTDLRFQKLDRLHEAAMVEFAREFRAEGDDRFDHLLDEPEEFFLLVERFEFDLELPEDRVPMSHFMLFSEDRLVAMSRLRRRLIPVLLRDGGHIGYEVRPSDRRRGYAGEILRRTLDEARRLGLERVLLTADDGNPQSIRVILRAGGVADGDSTSPRTGLRMLRFWIDF